MTLRATLVLPARPSIERGAHWVKLRGATSGSPETFDPNDAKASGPLLDDLGVRPGDTVLDACSGRRRTRSSRCCGALFAASPSTGSRCRCCAPQRAIGDAGINLAIQDAVAAANILAAPLREGRATVNDLRRVQKRREFPTRVTQRIQLAIQNRVIRAVLSAPGPLEPPLVARVLGRVPRLRRLPGRLSGLGVRPEHVRTQGPTAGGVCR